MNKTISEQAREQFRWAMIATTPDPMTDADAWAEELKRTFDEVVAKVMRDRALCALDAVWDAIAGELDAAFADTDFTLWSESPVESPINITWRLGPAIPAVEAVVGATRGELAVLFHRLEPCPVCGIDGQIHADGLGCSECKPEELAQPAAQVEREA